MKISSKGRYAVRIMTEIAKSKEKCVSVSEIANNQNISIKYTEQIISKLVKSKLVESFRGTTGGYKLIKSPKDINIAQILSTTGDAPNLAPCINSNCNRKSECETIGCWETLNTLIYNYLSSITLQDILDKNFK